MITIEITGDDPKEVEEKAKLLLKLDPSLSKATTKGVNFVTDQHFVQIESKSKLEEKRG